MARLTVGREVRFSAAHRLPHVPEGHKCGRMHGHTYRLRVEVVGEAQGKLGWVVDFGDIDDVLRTLVAKLDHRVLNEIKGLENPTSENLVLWCADKLRAPMAALGASLSRVEVYEGDGGGWCRWSA